MGNVARTLLSLLIVIVVLSLGQRAGHAAEVRFALVIGNDQYQAGTLATPANDAGLIADALGAAGFTVTGARNLDQATLRETFREFLGQVSAAGPDAVALVYLAGYGLQFEGENYFVPVDADIQRDVDVPLQAIRISDFTQPLAALPGHVKIVILDAARQNPFARGGQPLASGLALVDPAPNMAIAFNAAPGTIAPEEQGPYGAYASALTEMIGAGGLSLDDIFSRVRLRVSTLTQGVEVPWYASLIYGPFFMTERAADAPPLPNTVPVADIRNRPMLDYGNPDDAYAAALSLDTMTGYEQFLAAYPGSPYARRVAAMLAVRREETAWRRCVTADIPPAYWSYLRRYPNGPHAWDARRRLAMLGAPVDPPPDFAMFDFGVPPPPPDELGFLDQPDLMFDGPGFLPPPPPPLFFLPERPREFAKLPPLATARAVLPANSGCRRCSSLCPAAANCGRAACCAWRNDHARWPAGIQCFAASSGFTCRTRNAGRTSRIWHAGCGSAASRNTTSQADRAHLRRRVHSSGRLHRCRIRRAAPAKHRRRGHSSGRENYHRIRRAHPANRRRRGHSSRRENHHRIPVRLRLL